MTEFNKGEVVEYVETGLTYIITAVPNDKVLLEACAEPFYTYHNGTGGPKWVSSKSKMEGGEFRRVSPQLKGFAHELIKVVFEGGSLDAGDLQEMALDYGLLRKVEVTESCGEGCRCAEYDNFPCNCYRRVLGGG